MTQNLKFSHKILIAASLVVIAAFSLFTLYNDYLQRNAIRANLESYLDEMGEVTAHNIQNWLSGRLVLLESLAQQRSQAGCDTVALAWGFWRDIAQDKRQALASTLAIRVALQVDPAQAIS